MNISLPLRLSRPQLLAAGQLALILLSPLILIAACQTISLQSLPQAVQWLFSHLEAAGLWYLAVLLLQLALSGLTRLTGLAFLLAALPCAGLTLASFYKSAINGEPLALSDLAMAGNLGEIAGFASDKLAPSPATVGALVLLAAAVLALTALDALGRRAPRPALSQGLLLSGLCAVYLALLGSVPLAAYGREQYAAFPMQGDRDLACGVPLSLLSAWYGGQPNGSDQYGEVRMASLLWEMERAQASQPPSGVRPHVIFVMNESFFDLTTLPGLTFSQDPLPNYHRLQSDPGTTWGPFFTNTCGGGTGWVEMDTFTGVSNTLLDAASDNTAMEPEVYAALPSYVRVLRENGYRTVAFHAHTSELFNRKQNFPLLGFDEVLFREPFLEHATFFGGFFDDESAGTVLLSLFEKYREDPLFLYVLTMQNHQPYNSGRYKGEEKLEVSAPLLSPTELEMVNCYATGLYDADRMLGRLVDFFSQVEEPVLLVFTGDHRPGFANGDGTSVYTALGLVPTSRSVGWNEAQYYEMLHTDYLIWSNYAPGEGERPNSTHMMGASVLELAGVDTTPFYAWLAQTRREVLSFRHRILTVDPQGELVLEDSPETAGFWAGYQDVVFDLLYGEGYIARQANTPGGP